jgi:formate transporter FocA
VNTEADNQASFDALLPPAMAERAEQVGVRKAEGGPWRTLTLGVLAGAFIALGAVFATTITPGASEHLGWGPARLLSGLVFSLGLILVVVGGAELFTGNNLIVMAWAGGHVPLRRLLRNWALVYVGNLVGAVGTAALVAASGQLAFGGGEVGATALTIARHKLSLGFAEALLLGVLCNALVCLAVWLAMSARSTTDRILAVVPPVAAFVAAGFEHCVANMYFVPVALFGRATASEAFWADIGSDASAWSDLTWGGFLGANLLPVTLGNVIGGSGLVGLVYWFVYLRKR